MIRVVPGIDVELIALETTSTTAADLRILSLLKEFERLFAEPSGLPLSRGIYDHRIVLQPGIEPVNTRTYRYPPTKLDIIEELI